MKFTPIYEGMERRVIPFDVGSHIGTFLAGRVCRPGICRPGETENQNPANPLNLQEFERIGNLFGCFLENLWSGTIGSALEDLRFVRNCKQVDEYEYAQTCRFLNSLLERYREINGSLSHMNGIYTYVVDSMDPYEHSVKRGNYQLRQILYNLRMAMENALNQQRSACGPNGTQRRPNENVDRVYNSLASNIKKKAREALEILHLVEGVRFQQRLLRSNNYVNEYDRDEQVRFGENPPPEPNVPMIGARVNAS